MDFCAAPILNIEHFHEVPSTALSFSRYERIPPLMIVFLFQNSIPVATPVKLTTEAQFLQVPVTPIATTATTTTTATSAAVVPKKGHGCCIMFFLFLLILLGLLFLLWWFLLRP